MALNNSGMRNTHFITRIKNAQCALRNSHLIQTIGRMKTGEVIRKLRKHKKLTLAEVESRAGLSDGNLSRIERGEQWLSEEKLFAVAEALGVSPAEFFPQSSAQAPSAGVDLHGVINHTKGEHPVRLNDLIRLFTGFWESTTDGRKQILRMVDKAEKVERSRDPSSANDKR